MSPFSKQFEQDGYLVLPNFLNTKTCDFLIKRAYQLIDAFDPAHKSIFNTNNQSHANDLYFLNSGNKIHFFFENSAFNQSDELTTQKHLSINKIGHALHEHDPVFAALNESQPLQQLMGKLGINNPKIMQSMYMCKQPHIGSEVTCHQDSTYLYVHEQPITGFWFALQDADEENGCLWAIPGGHRTPLKSRMIRDQHDQIHFTTYDDTPWDLNKMVPLVAPRGTLVVLHGLLPHMSYENRSDRSRHAYTLHVMSGNHTYATDNWNSVSLSSPIV